MPFICIHRRIRSVFTSLLGDTPARGMCHTPPLNCGDPSVKTAQDVTDLIGNTPLIHLKKVSEETGCTILGKAEFLNPGGSVKDRTALGIIRAAEAAGELEPGGRIVEGTAGNTGIGLTLLANAMGYQSTVVMPLSQSREKIETLELLGADLHLVPATSYSDPKHYVHTAQRLAEKLAKREDRGAIWGETVRQSCQYGDSRSYHR